MQNTHNNIEQTLSFIVYLVLHLILYRDRKKESYGALCKYALERYGNTATLYILLFIQLFSCMRVCSTCWNFYLLALAFGSIHYIVPVWVELSFCFFEGLMLLLISEISLHHFRLLMWSSFMTSSMLQWK